MNKLEWMKELKTSIAQAPRFEIDRVEDFYNELYYDKQENGKTENEILREFGNPHDVGRKVLIELGLDRSEKEFPTFDKSAGRTSSGNVNGQNNGWQNERPCTEGNSNQACDSKNGKTQNADDAKKTQSSIDNSLIFKTFWVLIWFPFAVIAVSLVFSLVVTCIAVGFSFAVTGVGLVVGGIAAGVCSAVFMMANVWVGLVQLGCCLVVIAVGALLVGTAKPAIKLCLALAKKLWSIYSSWSKTLWKKDSNTKNV